MERTSGALSEREKQVVDLVADGFTNLNVATRLNISVETAKCHLYRSFQKLGVMNRVELANLISNQRHEGKL